MAAAADPVAHVFLRPDHVAFRIDEGRHRLTPQTIPILDLELLPEREGGYRFSNSDPITGQAAWYDLRVSVSRVALNERHETSPRLEPIRSPIPVTERAL